MGITCLSEATPRPFVMPAAKLKLPIVSVVVSEGILQGVCCLCAGWQVWPSSGSGTLLLSVQR